MKKIILVLCLIMFTASAHARLIDNGDGTITDTVRRIRFPQEGTIESYTKEQAEEYIAALNEDGSSWRLPCESEMSIMKAYIISWPGYTGNECYWTDETGFQGDSTVNRVSLAACFFDDKWELTATRAAKVWPVKFDSRWIEDEDKPIVPAYLEAQRNVPAGLVDPNCPCPIDPNESHLIIKSDDDILVVGCFIAVLW